MSQVSIAEAKNTLTHLIHEAERGEVIHITRHGKRSLFSSPRRHTNNSNPGTANGFLASHTGMARPGEF